VVFRFPVENGAGPILLSDSALVFGGDGAVRIFRRNEDGTVRETDRIQHNAPGDFGGQQFVDSGANLYWDTTDRSQPNAFVVQTAISARRWASCPALTNLDCASSTHP
jgi:hypothetical protein